MASRQVLGRSIRVAIVGQRFWCAHLEAVIQRHGNGMIEPTVVEQLSLASLESLRTADLLLRVGFRPGAPTIRGRAFDAFWFLTRMLNPSARVLFYWIGTDVLNAVSDHDMGRHTAAFRQASAAEHLAGAPWFVEELRACGLVAKSLPFPSGSGVNGPVPEMPRDFSVLTYIPDNRFEFYGGPECLAAARALPSVQFKVVGGSGSWVKGGLPENVVFHGWVNGMEAMYANASVVVRLVKHDGIGGTIRESLAMGRHAIYSYRYPHTEYVSWSARGELECAIRRLKETHEAGTLSPNHCGARYIREHLSDAETARGFIAELTGESRR